MRLKFLVLMHLVGAGLYVQAQVPAYPKDYFRSPMGIPMELSANFGELRPNHWHMGLDIRTSQQENLPIYAAAAGYIAKVGIRPQSFGRFIIINHPNGLSTLYAHLNDFYPELERYVTEQQYQNESWASELDFTSQQFPVSKGSFIAYSGNTGGSQGPHLHFEIMDTKTTKRLNPLLFNFPIQDNAPPVLFRLAMYDRSRSVYEQTPLIFPLKNTDSGYIIPKIPLIKTGLSKVSFALQMIDRMNGGGSDNGVYAATLYLDEEPQIAFALDSIDYDETHYINAHIDYKHDYNGGVFLQHLSQLPGHKGAEYKQLKSDGVLSLTDTTVRDISIDVKDAHGNTSQLNFLIQHDDSMVVQNYTNSGPKFIPARENVLKKPGFELFMPAACIYDSVPLTFTTIAGNGYNVVSDEYKVASPVYPVHDQFKVRIQPNKPVSKEAANKLVIALSGGKRNHIKRATLENGWITAEFGSFGSFKAYTDFSPPTINSLGNGDTVNLSAASRIVFTPTDNFGIRNFRAELYSCPSDTTGYLCPPDSAAQGNWLRFTNDKSRNWIYKFDDRCPYGVHYLKVTAEDLVGNITTRSWWFKRYPYTPPPPKKKTVKKTSSKKKVETKKGKTGKTDPKKSKTTTAKKPAVKKKK